MKKRFGGAATFIALILGSNAHSLAQTITIDPSRSIRTVSTEEFGINVPYWTGLTNYAAYLKEAGFKTLRWGGGSGADEYHWATNTNVRYPGADPTNIDTWLKVYTQVKAANAVLEVNYGTGTAQEAAKFVAYVESKGYHFRDYEIGNECYGDWEYDMHPLKHDPKTYAAEFAKYMAAMKAVDPTIKCGCPILEREDDWSLSPLGRHSVNPRTGVTHAGWTPNLLTYLRKAHAIPDFVVWHAYPFIPGRESDSALLSGKDLSGQTYAQHAATIRRMLNDYLGTAPARQVSILSTEFSTVSGSPLSKQTSSIVSALYMAQALGASTQTEIKTNDWWVFNNTNVPVNTNGNNSPSLYGWRGYGDYALVQTKTMDRYPTFYVAKLLNKWISRNDTVIDASSNEPLLAPYALKGRDGTPGMVVINTSPAVMYTATVALKGCDMRGAASVWSYGIRNDAAARTGIGNRDLDHATLNVKGRSFRYSFAPYSVTYIQIPVKNR